MAQEDGKSIDELYRLKKDIMRLNREIERRDITINRSTRVGGFYPSPDMEVSYLISYQRE